MAIDLSTRTRFSMRQLSGPAALLGASSSFLVGAAIAVPTLPTMGVLGAGGFRFAIAAVLLMLLLRPRLRGRGRRGWTRIVATGTVMAVMTLSSYAALAHLPLGTAATIEYLGPFAVAIACRRGRTDLISAGLALAGVALIAGPSLALSPIGVGFAALTAVALAAYILLQSHKGEDNGLDTLPLTFVVAAVLTAPFAIHAAPHLTADGAVRLLLSAVTGVVLAYALDSIGLKRVGARRASVLLSFDPALGALAGLVLLSQALPLRSTLGILTVVTAGLLASMRRRQQSVEVIPRVPC